MHATEEMLERHPDVTPERRRKLAAMTSSLDDGVGRILEAIDQEGLDENTMVIFINDNGGATNNASDNGIYRGMKGSKWEGGIRIPYAMRWPGTLPAGSVFDHPVSTLDIVPTAVAAAGVAVYAAPIARAATDRKSTVALDGRRRPAARPAAALAPRVTCVGKS